MLQQSTTTPAAPVRPMTPDDHADSPYPLEAVRMPNGVWLVLALTAARSDAN